MDCKSRKEVMKMASKDKETGLWIAQWYEIDVYGNKKRKKKRGFKTMREAKQHEKKMGVKEPGNMDMSLAEFMEQYFEDKKNTLKERTMKNKRYMMEQHIIPYFGALKMNEITAVQITKWQNEMYEKKFSESYLRMIQNQLTSLFTHACKIYDLKDNPCKKCDRMGKDDTRSLTFWTVDEYEKFIDSVAKGSRNYIMFEILFWTGIREGELLALTKADFDFALNQMKINKTYFRLDKQDSITSPKTQQSIRTIEIPQFLADEVKEWMDKKYEFPDDERLFPIGARALQKCFKERIDFTGVKQIRVHDLRHSHVAYLINKGVEPLIIKERLGHKDIKITLNTYGHLYPNQQKKVANLLDEDRNKKEF